MIAKRPSTSRRMGGAPLLRRLAVAAPLVAILGYIVFWFTVAGAAERQALAWIDAQRSRGITISHDGIHKGGFPFEVSLTVTAPKIAQADTQKWSWAGADVTLSGIPWALQRFNWQSPGEHRVTRTTDGHSLLLDAAGFEGWVEVAQGRFSQWEAWLTNSKVTTGGGKPVLDLRGLLVQHLPGSTDEPALAGADKEHANPNGGIAPRLPLTIDAKGLSMPKGVGGPLGDEVDRLTLDLSLNGPLSPGPWPEPALAWRDAGGVLEVKSLGLSYGPLNLTGDGTLALDAAGQPVGAFATRITGFGETIEAFKQKRLMDAATAATAQIVLGLLATGPTGGPKRLDVPVTLQDRTVSLGSVRLFRLASVPWFTTTKSP